MQPQCDVQVQSTLLSLMHLEWYRYSRNSVKNSLEKYLWSFTIELLFFVYLFIYCFYFVCVAFVVFTLSLLFVYFALTNCRLLIIIVHQVYVRLARFWKKKFNRKTVECIHVMLGGLTHGICHQDLL